MTKISIAIPTWECYGEGPRLLNDLLRTIEIQTFKDFEVIISDHSVDDEVLNEIKNFENSINFNYLKNSDNRGNSPANLNKAIERCNGELIKIMFQDDFFYDDEALEKIVNAFFNSDKQWLLNGTNHTADDGHSFYWELFPSFNEDLIKGVNTISSPSVVTTKKECILKFDENLKYLMDVDFYYRMKQTFGEPIFYNDILVTNRFPHKNSISGNIKNVNELLEEEKLYCLQKNEISK